jgi:signal transduction histidine kinase
MDDTSNGRAAVHAYYALAIAAFLMLLPAGGAWFAWGSPSSTDLAFGVPAMLAVFGVSLLAARHARSEARALAHWQEETRRRAMAEEALRQAHKLEAIGRLTGGIAHDFNNHLTVISSNVELLKRRLPETAPQLDRLADCAMEGVRRAATLTQRLLAFSRQQALDPEPVDAGALIAGMVDLLRRTLGEGVSVKTALSAGLWLTRIDVNQLESALLSLAVNAQDAMPTGGTLTIKTENVVLDAAYAAMHPDAAAGEYVMIAIGDTGTGMPPDVAARAFEPFFTTKPSGQGTGLGLSMVYGFVHQSGGHVRIDTTPKYGTTIRLYLPRYMQAPLMAAAPGLGGARNAGRGETLLVVEDDETLRQTAADALREIGYEVLEAPDAMEAVRLLADRGGIDLLFTDVGLPGGVNGRALADAAQNIHPELKVLFTTGYRDGSDLPAGEPFFLAKPFTLSQLEAKVRAVLDAPCAERATVRIESA